MSLEAELKFRMPRSSLQTLSREVPGATLGKPSEQDLHSTYFDTARYKLKRRGLSLRVRQAGDKHVQTVKAAGQVHFGRSEWETEVSDGSPDLRKINDTPLKRFGTEKLRRKLKPVFEASVRRVTVPVHINGSEIELAIDRGSINAGQRSSRIEEVELELKNGTPAELFRLAKTMERRAEAELFLRSKSDRGYDLARGKTEQAVFAETIELGKNTPAGDAFRVISRACVRHFAGNADAVRNGDLEGVHQMRVGLRRLRTAISLFSRFLRDEPTERIKTELKWLTEELAPSREIDVFVKERIRPLARDVVPRRAGTALEREFVNKRHSALDRANSGLGSPRFRALLVDVLEWIERAQKPGKLASTAIGKYASRVLQRRLKKILKSGRHLEELSARDRHKLRIRAKKIRYAIEFFASVFSKRTRKALSRLSKRLKKIQSALGSLNDFLAHRRMAAEAAFDGGPQNRRARAFAAGVIVGREDEAAKRLLKVASGQLGKLRGAGMFS